MSTARDVALIGIIIFVMSTGLFITFFVGKSMADVFLDLDIIKNSPEAVDTLEETYTVIGTFDYVILAIFMGLTIGILVTSWFVAGNPLFMFVYFMIGAIMVIVNAALSNAWETMTSIPIFGGQISSFPISNFLVTQSPYITSAILFIGMIVMFAKPALWGDI